jgi:uncharacterized membrane protein YfcA
VNVRTGLALAFYMALVVTLLSAVWSLISGKEINWIISLAIGFSTFCGAIIGVRHLSKDDRHALTSASGNERFWEVMTLS